MKSKVVMALAFSAASSLFASPAVSSVNYSQDPDTKTVTVTYELLGEAGIPLLDIRTNGVSIGWANLRFAAGDVHQVVQPGHRRIVWNPDKAWPGHSLISGVTAVVCVWPTDNPPDWLVVNCAKGYAGQNSAVRYYAAEEQLPEGTVDCETYKTDGKMAFRKIPAQGIVWQMGRGDSRHKVKLTSNYYLGVFEVTQSQYERFVGSNPSMFKTDGEMRPVECVSWDSVRGTSSVWPGSSPSEAYDSIGTGSFMYALRQHASACKFDLPTEAQWEFACRAGSGADYPDGSSWTSGSTENPFLETHARYKNNSGRDSEDRGNTLSTNDATAVVGSYLPNRWGLHDMHGNLYEWVLDYADDPVPTGDVTVDPVGVSDEAAANPLGRLTRGGSYLLAPAYLRSDSRSKDSKRTSGSRNVGFRVCIPLFENK